MKTIEAREAELEPGAAGIFIRLENGTINVYHATDRVLLMKITEVKAGTWDNLWRLLEGCGKAKCYYPNN